MLTIFENAGNFIAVILLGYVLKRIGWFKKEDFFILSKILVCVTAPATIALSMADKTIDLSLLSLILLGLGSGILLIAVAFFLQAGKGKSAQSFAMTNMAGYNIGCFTLPFVQSVLGPGGIIAVSLFDVGNAVISLGGAYGAAAVVKGGRSFNLKLVLDKLLHSVMFVVYIFLVVINLCGLRLPDPVLSLLEIPANANPFLAMFMLGVGFEFSGETSQGARMAKLLLVRYAVSGVLAAAVYCLSPFPLEVRQALVIIFFSPIASIAPAFTAELEEDVGLASAMNTISIVCSVCMILVICAVML